MRYIGVVLYELIIKKHAYRRGVGIVILTLPDGKNKGYKEDYGYQNTDSQQHINNAHTQAEFECKTRPRVKLKI